MMEKFKTGGLVDDIDAKDRYKAQWCRAHVGFPESWPDDIILEKVAGTVVEKLFEQHLLKRKAVFQLKMAIKDVFPRWLARVLPIKKRVGL